MRRFMGTQMCATLLVIAVGFGALPQRSAAACIGDCDGGGDVTVNELITMVNIALGSALLSTCPVGDADGSGDITINEIIAAVNNALGVCPISATPTPTAPVITPTPTITPTLGVLGVRHFALNPAHSQFTAVLGQGLAIPLGGFLGQKDGVTGQQGYLDLQAGQPDGNGYASIDIVGASDYLYVDASALAQIVICIKPLVPVSNAGLVACNGGLDFSIALTTNHHLGQLGVEGFTLAQCTSLGGNVESPNQICGAGTIGEPCRVNSECDSTSGAGDGVCGLRAAHCSAPAAKQGAACQADGDCDTTAEAQDGVCGNPGAHPGVCNGSFQVSQLGADSGPGAVTIAPVPQFGLNGLPVELNIEAALPCGDEGTGFSTPFAFTSGEAKATILNFSDMTNVCSAGNNGAECTTNADCDSASGAGDGVCGATLVYDVHGQNFSCANWQAANAPGCVVLNAPQLDANPGGGDIITGFRFCGQ